MLMGSTSITVIGWTPSCDEISIQSGLSEREYLGANVVGKQTEAADQSERKAGETVDSKKKNRNPKSLEHTQHSQETFTYHLLVSPGTPTLNPWAVSSGYYLIFLKTICLTSFFLNQI